MIALHEDNIYDKMIARLSEEQKSILNKRYYSLSLQPEKMKFIDRMVADRRQIALNHTAGLSLPQQMQLSLFAIFSLLDKEDGYKAKMQEIIQRRLHALWDNTGFTLVEDPLRAGYYSEQIGEKRIYIFSLIICPNCCVIRLSARTVHIPVSYTHLLRY